VAEVKDDIVIMDDGTLRAIVAVSSTNFDLKNQDEQNSIVVNYQRFLNSLDFPVQILMQSRRMDINSYVQKLKGFQDRQTNELLRIQTSEYIEFIEHLVETANIMNKNFYVIVPLDFSINPSAPGFFARLFRSTKIKQISQRLDNFAKERITLDERALSIVSTLASIGLRSVRLTTEQLIELFYFSYNFESAPMVPGATLSELATNGEEDAKKALALAEQKST
jgi:adenosine deaminase